MKEACSKFSWQSLCVRATGKSQATGKYAPYGQITYSEWWSQLLQLVTCREWLFFLLHPAPGWESSSLEFQTNWKRWWRKSPLQKAEEKDISMSASSVEDMQRQTDRPHFLLDYKMLLFSSEKRQVQVVAQMAVCSTTLYPPGLCCHFMVLW